MLSCDLCFFAFRPENWVLQRKTLFLLFFSLQHSVFRYTQYTWTLYIRLSPRPRVWTPDTGAMNFTIWCRASWTWDSCIHDQLIHFTIWPYKPRSRTCTPGTGIIHFTNLVEEFMALACLLLSCKFDNYNMFALVMSNYIAFILNNTFF